MTKRLWIFAGVLLSLAGCGYGLIGRTSNLPEDIENIFVEPLQNRTTRQQVELYMTEAIVNELVTRRRFTILNSATNADAVLRGILTAYTVRPVEFGPDGRATSYNVSIRADMEFKRQGSDEVLWAQGQYVFRSDFELELDEEQGTVFDTEDAASQTIARQFARSLITDLLEGF